MKFKYVCISNKYNSQKFVHSWLKNSELFGVWGDSDKIS